MFDSRIAWRRAFMRTQQRHDSCVIQSMRKTLDKATAADDVIDRRAEASRNW
jgi:hypothetical protein